MSPWVRIDENALEHPKIAALSHGAVVLWIQGLAYCQKFLTDGLICRLALRGLRAFNPKRHAELLAAKLWDAAEDGAVRVHDFLDWNESRDRIVAAREQWRDKKRRLRESPRGTPTRQTEDTPLGVISLGVGSSGKEGAGRKPNGNGNGRVFRDPSPSEVPDEVAERAGRFAQETYPALYRKYRNGAFYLGKPTLDFQEALKLCQVWDDERLQKIATVFLTTDHEFAEKGSRSMAQFRSMASWCDSRLREQGQ